MLRAEYIKLLTQTVGTPVICWVRLQPIAVSRGFSALFPEYVGPGDIHDR